jgi:hypothetical protein
VAEDLFLGKTRRNWARRDQDLLLTTAPVLNPAPRKPYQELVSDAKSLDRSLRVRPSGRGAVVTKIFKWG